MWYTKNMKKADYSAKICAKINLSLAITGKKEDMHLLDMIVYPLHNLYDEAYFSPTTDGKISIHILSGYRGLKKRKFKKAIIDKVALIADKLGLCGKVYIKKNIPLGGGLGGSTASVVAVLKAMQAYLKSIGKDCEIDNDFLLSLGSDAPCMYVGGVCRVQGIGDIVTPLEYDKQLQVQMAIAKGGSNSKDCYHLYDTIENINTAQNIDLVDFKNAGTIYPHSNTVCKDLPLPTTVDEALAINRNDLYEIAILLNPKIQETAVALHNHTNKKVFMSGSGSTVFCVNIIE